VDQHGRGAGLEAAFGFVQGEVVDAEPEQTEGQQRRPVALGRPLAFGGVLPAADQEERAE
jgi:hypothetical protein